MKKLLPFQKYYFLYHDKENVVNTHTIMLTDYQYKNDDILIIGIDLDVLLNFGAYYLDLFYDWMYEPLKKVMINGSKNIDDIKEMENDLVDKKEFLSYILEHPKLRITKKDEAKQAVDLVITDFIKVIKKTIRTFYLSRIQGFDKK